MKLVKSDLTTNSPVSVSMPNKSCPDLYIKKVKHGAKEAVERSQYSLNITNMNSDTRSENMNL